MPAKWENTVINSCSLNSVPHIYPLQVRYLVFAKTEFSFLGKEQCFKYTFIYSRALSSRVHLETVGGLVIV